MRKLKGKCESSICCGNRQAGTPVLRPLETGPGFHEIPAAVADGARVDDLGAWTQMGVCAQRVARGVFDLDGHGTFDPVRLDLTDLAQGASGALRDQATRCFRGKRLTS